MSEKRYWLIGVAALMAAIFLYDSIGPEGVMVLAGGALVGFAGHRFWRSRNRAGGSGVRCLTCGEMLAATARSCKHCGSARWTVN